MKNGGLQFWIDAGCGRRGYAACNQKGMEDVFLVPDGGEYAEAVHRLRELGEKGPSGRRVPDEVFLHLFAYELLERMREYLRVREGDRSARIVLPFWPECLFEAAGLYVHGAREIQNLFPEASGICYVSVSDEAVASEARRVLGDVRIDPGTYSSTLRALAEREGWQRIETGGDEDGQ